MGREDAVRLQEALGRMRANYREAIVLRFGLGLTVPEIAAHVGISLPAAKKLVLRATEQARRRLQAIEGAEFCRDAQDLARRSLADKELTGIASEEEQGLLRSHLRHCGHCRSFLAELRHGLHELGGSALLVGRRGRPSSSTGSASLTTSAAGSATRPKPLRRRQRSSASPPSRRAVPCNPVTPTSAGLLSGTAQKALAVCGAATATTATCLATGVIGPGLGATGLPSPQARAEKPAALNRPLEESSLSEAPPGAAPQPTPPQQPEAQQPVPAPEPPPPGAPEASSEQFGFESSAPPPEAAPAPAPEPAPTPSTSSSSASSGGGGGGGGGGEHFGFGG